MHDDICSDNEEFLCQLETCEKLTDLTTLNEAQTKFVNLDGNCNYEEEFMPDVRKLRGEVSKKKYDDGMYCQEDIINEMRTLSGIKTTVLDNGIDYYQMPKHELVKIIARQNKLLKKQAAMITKLLAEDINDSLVYF